MERVSGIIFVGENQIQVTACEGETLLAILRQAGITVSAPCGGGGTCGKCRVIASGALSALTAEERRFLPENEMARGVRLACQCLALGDFTVRLNVESLQVETDYRGANYDFLPMVEARRENGTVSFYIDGECVDTADAGASNLGLAVDIGTTTVAVYLCDLDAGRVMGTRGFRNPQASYGADVISRIDKIMKDPAALGAQQGLIVDSVNAAARELCASRGLAFADIRAAVLCGNTVMEHIAAGIDPSSIANAPFTAPTLFGTIYQANALGLLENEHAVVYFAPCFASYVGGDIACGMIAAGLDVPQDNVLFIDVGTNGEIGLSTKNGLYFCSAAAGPAFEGAHIACGMAGAVGAVSKIQLAEGKITHHVIGDVPPVGICGSGIIDAVAVMLDAGLLDETGRIVDADEAGDFSSYIGEDENGNPIFWIDREHDIYMNGRDIREVQLAKAAICAGIRTLLHKAGLSVADVSEVVLAGGFGSHIDKTSACRIGLVPRELDGKVVSAGNTAGAGAVAILMGGAPRASARTICGKSDYTELSGDAYFMEAYIEEMMFEE